MFDFKTWLIEVFIDEWFKDKSLTQLKNFGLPKGRYKKLRKEIADQIIMRLYNMD